MTETTDPPVAPRAPGRPRSERAEKAILDATLELLAAESGVDGVSIEAVAALAGVAKTTIYRRWPNKEALIVGALAEAKAPLPEPRGESVRDDLLAIAEAIAAGRNARHSRCFWNVLGSHEKYPGLYERYYQQVIQPRRETVFSVLRAGIARGELRPDIDLEVVNGLLVGPFHVPRPGAPLPDGYARKVVETVLRAIGTERS
ncbi:TetR/AcrR family transcriptional regulator [Spirillospora sp. CA-294931]|uniref:TetR/AcrR family transcriptional regulator n=1 Tax=Spirillospora sp. CA-294931 TaxID=3240042 RepID=UPI003D90FCDC